jgi:histidinol-phosphatase (PHP family)
MKIVGHTHTHYCPRGSGEEAVKYIERIIESGFDVYVLTDIRPWRLLIAASFLIW